MNETAIGTQFDFTYAPGISSAQILGFEMAGEIWSSYLRDDVSIQIYVEATSKLPENVVGGALPALQGNINYDNLWRKMSADITSGDDLIAWENLPSEEQNFYTAMVDGEELDKGKKIQLTTANAKALDLQNRGRNTLDGYILISDLTGMSDASWNYDFRGDRIQNDRLDYLSVALHEIGHVLGFVSGIDDGNWLTTLTQNQQTNRQLRDTAISFATPLDFFRYSHSSAIANTMDFSTGENSFFSIDGGKTNLGGFSTGQYQDLGGDGFQASHWKNTANSLGVMQPLLETGVKQEISDLDLMAIDVIGWDVQASELDWQKVYANAVQNADAATIADRSADVRGLIRNNEEYHGRLTPYSGGYIGFWQFSNIEASKSVTEAETIEQIETAQKIETVETEDLIFPDLNNELAKEETEDRITLNGDISVIDRDDDLLLISDGDWKDRDLLFLDDLYGLEVETISDLDTYFKIYYM